MQKYNKVGYGNEETNYLLHVEIHLCLKNVCSMTTVLTFRRLIRYLESK